MWRVDLHAHTHESKDSLLAPERLIAAARRAGLSRIAVTDHNSARTALELAEREPEFVIPGEEILTTRGELLAYFIREEVPPGLTPHVTIERLRAQGAVISVAHPFDRLRGGHWAMEDLEAIAPHVDAAEGFNARCLFAGDNTRAQAFARGRSLGMTAGTDAHAAWEVGRAGLALEPFANASELRRALHRGTLFGRRAPWWVHFFSRYASLRKHLARQT